MTPDPDPLRTASDLSALRNLTKRPDPASDFSRAHAPMSRLIRSGPEEREEFDDFQRSLETAARRRVTQVETLQWVLGAAMADREALIARFKAANGAGHA